LHGRYRMAVVSSSSRLEVETALEVAGIRQYFAALVCGREAGQLKPAPDPYLKAAELLQSKRPLVVEDSEAGIASAQAAGFAFARVPSVAEMAASVRASL
jgi:HAD superfamily hydrolase (TIGR01509 family)